MAWVLDKSRPICPQICEQICVRISHGEYGPNEKIPSVRDIALEAGVNPNTVQKALTILTDQGLLYSMRGSGMYVNADTENASLKIDQLKKKKTLEYFEEMESLGMTYDDIKEYVKEWKK